MGVSAPKGFMFEICQIDQINCVQKWPCPKVYPAILGRCILAPTMLAAKKKTEKKAALYLSAAFWQINGQLFLHTCKDGGVMLFNAGYAIDKITALTIDFRFHQAMTIGLKAWELLVEGAHEFQVIDNRLIETLTRNQ